MSTVDTALYGESTSTVYQRQQQEKTDAASGKVSHTDFLKLLTQQLVNQDPLNPMQDIDFTGQLAQLQALDEQMAMTKSMQAMRLDTQIQAGTNMIGKYVSGVDTTGASVSGQVKRLNQTDGSVYVELTDGRKIGVSDVGNVWNDAQSMYQEIANSSNVIGMWVECGYDSAMQPIKGIVESMQVVNGQVALKLYGGKTVTWDQIQSMRHPTDEEQFYVLPDAVRQKVEKAQKMVGMTIDGVDVDGKEVSGIVGDAVLNGSDVFLILYTGELVKVENVKGDPREPTADDAAASLNGLWCVGLNANGEEVKGVIVGAEEDDSGMYVILDNGTRVHFDSVTEVRDAENSEKAHLHGLWFAGVTEDGDEVEGIVVQKTEVDGNLAVVLKDGSNTYTVLCKNLGGYRDPTTEETAAVKEQQDNEG